MNEANVGKETNRPRTKEDRARVINKICREKKVLMARRAEISEEINALHQERVKAELGMKIADFNSAFRLYNLEDERRDAYVDTVRECFEALMPGEQLDWLNGQGSKKAKDRPEGPSAEALAAARNMGHAGGSAGKSLPDVLTNSPYTEGQADLRAQVVEGWNSAQGDLVNAIIGATQEPNNVTPINGGKPKRGRPSNADKAARGAAIAPVATEQPTTETALERHCREQDAPPAADGEAGAAEPGQYGGEYGEADDDLDGPDI